MRFIARGVVVGAVVLGVSVLAAAPSYAAGSQVLPDDVGPLHAVCDLAWTRSPHALVNPDPESAVGVLFSDAVAIVGTGYYAGLPATDVVVRCFVQLNEPSPGAVAPVADGSGPAGVGVGVMQPASVSFHVTRADTVYICGVVTWRDPDGESRSRAMGYPSENGQCTAISPFVDRNAG